MHARFEPGKDNVFTECDNERHDARRRKMAAGYAGKENPTLEPSIDTHVKQLIHLIRTKYASSASSADTAMPMDMASKIQYFTLDVVSDVGLGKPIGDLASDSDINSYLEAMGVGLRIANASFGLGTSWLRAVPLVGPAISPSEKDATGYGRMMAEARKIIEERRSKPTQEKSDMIASFIRNGVSGDDLFQEVFETLLAGSDTTAAAIRIIMLYLMSTPRVYAKLRAEIDATATQGLAPATPAIVSDAEARKLPYLGAVVREAMRVHPPVVNLFSRVAPPTGDVVTVQGKEYFIPGGTMIGYSAFGMHRHNTDLYGSDAHVFRPERWLLDESVPGEKDRLAKMQKVNDMVFGYGRWVCLGRHIALMEIHKVIFELVRGFEFAIVRPEKPWEVFETMGLWDIRGMWVNVVEREHGQ
ncbi:hypothetical protein N0V90_001053 [Kalmusia sp. IMI 367209]|nr:hypothetical protein N0V90_001053 [Kalmusia sp. IMI 367209]